MPKHPLEAVLSKLETETINNFKKVLRKFGPGNITGYGLCSDESGGSIAIALNTSDHLKKRTTKDPKFSNDWRFSIPEWFSEDIPSNLKKTNDTLYDYMYSDEVTARFPKDRDVFFNACVIILQSLIPLIPKNINPDFVLVFEVNEFDNKKSELSWFKKLNSKDAYKVYSEWRNSF